MRCLTAVITVTGTMTLAFAAPVPAMASPGPAGAASTSVAHLPGHSAGADPAWAVQPVPAPAVPNGQLSAVSCSAATACTAVGYDANKAGKAVLLAERWNGTNWSIQATPHPVGASGSIFSAVSCTSARACTATGYTVSSGGLQGTLAEHWDGTSWSIQATPNPAGASVSALSGVSCTSATACTATGSASGSGEVPGTLAEHWNGTAWSIQATPTPAGASGSALSGVSCPSATDCTAAGYSFSGGGLQTTLAERWDGTNWSIQASPNPAGAGASSLGGVSCTSSSGCTAVGNYTDSSGNQLTLAERWDGTNWSVQATPNPAGASVSVLNGVSCTSATACTAVGQTSAANNIQALAERWDGTSWSIQATPSVVLGDLLGVSCSSATVCTAAGNDVNTISPKAQLTLAERWNGTIWSVQAPANRTGAWYSSLASVACSSATACTAVGQSTRRNGPPVPLAERWDGTSWSIQATPDTGANSAFTGVSCPSATDCTAVGFSFDPSASPPLAEHWDGTSWSIQATPTPAGASGSVLNAVSCTSATACTAVGYSFSGGTYATLAEHWDGTSWSVQATPNLAGATAIDLLGVSCTTATACTAAGLFTGSTGTQATLAESWNGTSWSIQATPNPAGATASGLNGVSCTSATACTAVGNYTASDGTQVTLAERWDGTSWSIQTMPGLTGDSDLGGVSCTSATACVAAGSSNGGSATLAEVWNGTSWSVQATRNPGTSPTFSGVSCALATTCTAVGGYTNTATNSPLAERYS